jgi:protein TonB
MKKPFHFSLLISVAMHAAALGLGCWLWGTAHVPAAPAEPEPMVLTVHMLALEPERVEALPRLEVALEPPKPPAPRETPTPPQRTAEAPRPPAREPARAASPGMQPRRVASARPNAPAGKLLVALETAFTRGQASLPQPRAAEPTIEDGGGDGPAPVGPVSVSSAKLPDGVSGLPQANAGARCRQRAPGLGLPASDGSHGEGAEAASAAALGPCKPKYPLYSRIHGEEGTVVLSVEIDESGRCGKIDVVGSSGCRRLDQAAIEALRRTPFKPASRAGKPVPSTKRIAIVFRLQDAEG